MPVSRDTFTVKHERPKPARELVVLGTLLGVPTLKTSKASGADYIVLHLQCHANTPARQVVVLGLDARVLLPLLAPHCVVMATCTRAWPDTAPPWCERYKASHASVMKYAKRVDGNYYNSISQLGCAPPHLAKTGT